MLHPLLKQQVLQISDVTNIFLVKMRLSLSYCTLCLMVHQQRGLVHKIQIRLEFISNMCRGTWKFLLQWSYSV